MQNRIRQQNYFLALAIESTRKRNNFIIAIAAEEQNTKKQNLEL